MAYLRLLGPPPVCKWFGCEKKATHLLVDRWNGERGEYCARHAEKALAEQKKNEGGV